NEMSKVRVKYDGRYLQAYMPNGDIIPLQTDIKVENEVGQNNEATVTIQCIGDISELTEADKTVVNLRDEITHLKDRINCIMMEFQSLQQSADYYKEEYVKELNKTDYKGMFYIFLVLFLFVSIVLYFKL